MERSEVEGNRRRGFEPEGGEKVGRWKVGEDVGVRLEVGDIVRVNSMRPGVELELGNLGEGFEEGKDVVWDAETAISKAGETCTVRDEEPGGWEDVGKKRGDGNVSVGLEDERREVDEVGESAADVSERRLRGGEMLEDDAKGGEPRDEEGGKIAVEVTEVDVKGGEVAELGEDDVYADPRIGIAAGNGRSQDDGFDKVRVVFEPTGVDPVQVVGDDESVLGPDARPGHVVEEAAGRDKVGSVTTRGDKSDEKDDEVFDPPETMLDHETSH